MNSDSGGNLYLRGDRLHRDDARHSDAARLANENTLASTGSRLVVLILDNSPIDLCGDKIPSGIKASTVLVAKKNITTDDEYNTNVRHRMFNLLKLFDVEGSTTILS